MNTPTPAPTPYDILPIPAFPFIPALWVWLATISFFVIGYILIQLLMNRSAQVKIKKLGIVLAELEKVSGKELDSTEATRISMIVRRYLASESATLGSAFQNIPALAGVELQKLLTASSNPELKTIISGLLELEDSKFSPNKTPIKSATEMQKALLRLSENKDIKGKNR
jgi:hypothetical protein